MATRERPDVVAEALPEALIGDGAVYVTPAQLRLVVERVREALARTLERVDALEQAPPSEALDGLWVGDNLDAPADPAASHDDDFIARVTLFWDTLHERLHVGGAVLVGENGDTPEVGLRRSEGTYRDGTPVACTDGLVIGLYHWTGWTDFTGPSHPNGRYLTRSGQIYVRAKGNLTRTNQGGEMHFAVTPQGTANGTVDGMILRHDGTVEIINKLIVRGPLLHFGSGIRFFSESSPVAKQTVTGSRGGNAALASLLAALHAYGLITDSTTA